MINTISHNYAQNSVTNPLKNGKETSPVIEKQQQMITDTVHISEQGKIADIMSRYNLNSITSKQTVVMSTELYEANAISLLQHGLLSFQPELQPGFEHTTIGKAMGGGFEENTPKDLVAFWEKQLEYQESSGQPVKSIENTRDVVNLLHRLQNLG